MEYYEFRAMNTSVVLAAEGDATQITRGFEHVAAFIEKMETQLTRFSETNELAQLNRSDGTWFHASEELFAIVRDARDFFRQTDGLFDPSVLDTLEREGYNQSMDKIRAYGATASQDSTPLVHRDFGAVELDDGERNIRLPRGMRMDLGGIAKGWIAEHAAAQLAEYVHTCAVDAGGDMFMVGQPSDNSGWHIALEDPRDPNHALAILHLGPGAIATSSVTKRRWSLGGIFKNHLIDPRRGASAESDWLAVTVIAPQTTTAEVFAKALLIAGSQQATALAARRGDVEFIAVDREGKMWGSNKAKEYLDDGNE